MRPQAPADGQTVFAGQGQIENNDVRRLPRQCSVERRSITNGPDGKIVLAKIPHQKTAQLRIVVNHDNTGRFA
jgi:hypothetical protein